MTATEIIEEIKHLTPSDQVAVTDFVLELTGRSTPLSGERLEELATRLADAAGEGEGKRLKAEIHRGFYGKW